MSLYLKQSTAVVISFGPAVDPTDGVTLETGLVSALDHASTGIMLSKNGGAMAVRNAAVTATTYDAYGNYLVTLDIVDTNTLGGLRVQFAAAASCLPVWQDFEVLPPNVYDWLVGGTDKLNLAQLNIVATGDDSAIVARGSGSGSGVEARGGGDEGDGFFAAGGAESDGYGIVAVGTGAGAGIAATGGATGVGLSVAIPDSAAADGDQPTLLQAIYEILQFLTEKSVASTTLTVNNPGGTPIMTFTLDSATDPTSITRAS